jgi:SAM-dependent methyltransferase
MVSSGAVPGLRSLRATARRRVARTVRTVNVRRAEADDSSDRCLVCGSPDTAVGTATFVKSADRTIRYRQCGRCQFVQVFDNEKAYVSAKKYPMSPRIGTETVPGRELHMVKLATDVLGRKVDVLINGAGISQDFRHAAKIKRVRDVWLSDFVNFHEVPNFFAVGTDPGRRFDVIVACEVLEHFTRPRADFMGLARMLEPGGLMVCSTNIYDGSSDLSRHLYPFIKGHCAYWTPRAIETVARDAGLHVDFRVPEIALGKGGPRKRYVLFSRSPEVMRSVTRYFARHLYAPSEPAVPKVPAPAASPH